MDFWPDEERKPHQLKEKKFVRGWMRNERNDTEGPFSKVTSIIAEYKGRVGLARFWRPGDPTIANNPQASQEKSTSILKTGNSPSPPCISASVPGPLTTSSNWLISLHLSGSQLHWLSWASVERKAENQEEKKTLSSHYSSSFPYSLPRPSQAPLPCLFLRCVLYLKTLFITIFSFMWREPLASFQWPVCREMLLPPN